MADAPKRIWAHYDEAYGVMTGDKKPVPHTPYKEYHCADPEIIAAIAAKVTGEKT